MAEQMSTSEAVGENVIRLRSSNKGGKGGGNGADGAGGSGHDGGIPAFLHEEARRRYLNYAL